SRSLPMPRSGFTAPFNPTSRRQFLRSTASGFGMLGLVHLLAAESAAADGEDASGSSNPLHCRSGHFSARAQRIIFLFMAGGPSHVDTFDPKPLLTRDHGKPLPFTKPRLERSATGNLFGSPFRFSKHGQSGLEISELFPQVAKCADELCVIRSLVAD